MFKVFRVVVDADVAIAEQFLEVHEFDAGDFAGAAEGNAFLLEEGDSFAPRVRYFSQPIALGEGVGKVEGNLHGLGSLVKGFAELVILEDG